MVGIGPNEGGWALWNSRGPLETELRKGGGTFDTCRCFTPVGCAPEGVLPVPQGACARIRLCRGCCPIALVNRANSNV